MVVKLILAMLIENMCTSLNFHLIPNKDHQCLRFNKSSPPYKNSVGLKKSKQKNST